MNRIHRRVALATCLALVGPAAAVAAAKTVLSFSGSTSVYPLAVALATEYHKSHPNIGFRILQGGSDIGIDDVAHGRVTIGDSSRDPIIGVDPHGLAFNKIARDGICVITSPRNTLPGLNQSQIQQIFSGHVTNWRNVPGAKVSGAIHLYTRTAASGTADAFKQIFMGQNLNVSGAATPEPSNGLVAQAVNSDQQGAAIGFVSFDFVNGNWAVPYNGTACTLRNAKSGQYGGVRNFWMVTRGAPTGAAAAFIRWVQHSADANGIINTHWVPLH
jgi:phosphate transport system substrate-binding protein